ncbi:transposase [Bradyrhizobium sp. NBAIM32]|nr:transposase [Bradyrhizobium sp. NBAIM32]
MDVLSENQSEDESEAERKGRQSGKRRSAPPIWMRQWATNARNRRLESAYKQHAAVDNKVGVILDVAVTTGQTNEGETLPGLIQFEVRSGSQQGPEHEAQPLFGRADHRDFEGA